MIEELSAFDEDFGIWLATILETIPLNLYVT